MSPAAESSQAARAYAQGGYRDVPGWLQATAVDAFVALMESQRAAGVSGPVAEIGPHLGRTLILLHLLSAGTETSVGFDLYELQNEAVGRERKRRLLDYLARHGGDSARVRLVTCDSAQLDAQRFIEHCGGKPRLVSIDAGRSAAAVAHDLALARAALCARGVVSITDYFREAWPEVSEGCCRFMNQSGGLWPVAIGGNKFFFTNDAHHAAALQQVLAQRFADRARPARIFGQPVLLLAPLTWRRRMARTALWRRIRHTSAGTLIRKLVTPGR